jgi:hypothetical protein
MQAIIATQAHTALYEVAQLADKIAEVAPPPCVAGVSSPGEISILTARIDELTRQVAALRESLTLALTITDTTAHKAVIALGGTVTSP